MAFCSRRIGVRQLTVRSPRPANVRVGRLAASRSLFGNLPNSGAVSGVVYRSSTRETCAATVYLSNAQPLTEYVTTVSDATTARKTLGLAAGGVLASGWAITVFGWIVARYVRHVAHTCQGKVVEAPGEVVIVALIGAAVGIAAAAVAVAYRRRGGHWVPIVGAALQTVAALSLFVYAFRTTFYLCW